MLKIYRGHGPFARRDREAETLQIAAGMQVNATPSVLATGEYADVAWSVLTYVPGSPCTIATTADVRAYIDLACTFTAEVHRHARGRGLSPGDGWRCDNGDSVATHAGYLAGQMSSRCRQQSWWPDLRTALAALDDASTVYLHGDLKPEHVLIDDTAIYVVDWEASARGPAACDYADIMFHLVRDLVYDGVPGHRLPLDALGGIPVVGPAVAWRLALWLDRRRPKDIQRLRSCDICRLAGSATSTDAAGELAGLIARFRADGVPR